MERHYMLLKEKGILEQLAYVDVHTWREILKRWIKWSLAANGFGPSCIGSDEYSIRDLNG